MVVVVVVKFVVVVVVVVEVVVVATVVVVEPSSHSWGSREKRGQSLLRLERKGGRGRDSLGLES